MKLIAFVAVIMMCVSPVAAEKKRIPTSGSLASSFEGGGSGANSIGADYQGDVLSDKQAPLSGSISRIDGRTLRAVVINNSKDSYSVSLKAVQYDENGKQVKSDFFSTSLKANEKYSREVPASLQTRNSELVILNWKKTSRAVETPTPASGEAAE